MNRVIPEQDFVVLNLKTTKIPSIVMEWWRTQSNVATAESCARQVWFGTQYLFAKCPDKADLIYGEDAYAFMLRLMTGMESAKKGETEIKRQILDGWRDYKGEQGAMVPVILETVMQHLQADSRFVKELALNGHKQNEHCLVSRQMSTYQRGSAALVVGDLNRSGNLSEYTDRTLRALNNRNRRSSGVFLTHPSQEVREQMRKELDRLKKEGILKTVVDVHPFEDLPQFVEIASATFIDLPMGKNPEADAFIQSVWSNRVKQESSLVHLRGKPELRGMSSSEWAELMSDPSYISPEDIYKERGIRSRNNKEKERLAIEISAICAQRRAEGQDVTKRILKRLIQPVEDTASTAGMKLQTA